DEKSHFEVEEDEEYEGDVIGPPEEREMETDDEEVHEMDFGDTTLEYQYGVDLRSCVEIVGYMVVAGDGIVGHVKALLFEDEEYLVRYVVVDTMHHGNGKVVLVPEEWVRTVVWEEKALHVDMDRRTIINSPAFITGTLVTRDIERKLYDYVDHL
ncbi:MAG: hypothetical protein GF344_09640, partial [Chitinivibrionales bacterium]|nr:hypothetical protein [Chitinivibrionales bacterium]MBD3357104.1 hypothetical protein [Chitinivibrionales bacterium]